MISSFEKFEPIPGLHGCIRRFRSLLKVSEKFDHILIRGPRGCGKSYFLKEFIEGNDLPDEVAHINCATIHPATAESELFGHVQGAFTGAHKEVVGHIKSAEKHGVLLLEEINSLPLEIQAKLLVFMETMTYYPMGSRKKETAEVRIVATANNETAHGIRFDVEDRFKITIDVPPLYLRRNDIFYYVGLRYPNMEFGIYDLFRLYNRPWPGNFRELEKVLFERKSGLEIGSFFPTFSTHFHELIDQIDYSAMINIDRQSRKKRSDRKTVNDSNKGYFCKISLSKKPVAVWIDFLMGSKETLSGIEFVGDRGNSLFPLPLYKSVTITIYDKNKKEIQKLPDGFVPNTLSKIYGSGSLKYHKDIFEYPEETESKKMESLTPQQVANYLISNQGVFPEVMRSIVENHQCGGQSRLSEILGVPRNTISNWKKSGRF
ncbi:sigma 54-interacting transcriptional regulator [Desulfofustis limnaeus]|uniref:Sigma-54 factor interaction domain-containing protein n=1 Tax=Desulfofustis limnaeus TaxID=2740163 RepID=A0ABM7WAR7_9BACT|nr:sigma 54-interacting transcriptional regulator [Desulfofustis limnaeus]BDD88006.1 hypothetical protein DPPLL_23710 [Desulfofustis limnaeus]